MSPVLVYVQQCTSMTLPVAECGPVWQLGVIAALIVCSVGALIVLRLSPRARPQD